MFVFRNCRPRRDCDRDPSSSAGRRATRVRPPGLPGPVDSLPLPVDFKLRFLIRPGGNPVRAGGFSAPSRRIFRALSLCLPSGLPGRSPAVAGCRDARPETGCGQARPGTGTGRVPICAGYGYGPGTDTGRYIYQRACWNRLSTINTAPHLVF